MELDGRTALVTGAARGLGLAIAGALSDAGAQVALGDVDADGLQAATSGLERSHPVLLDVGDPESARLAIDEVVQWTGRLDILVNNAGYQRVGPVAEFDDDVWQSMVQTMLVGTFLCSKYALPHLRRAGAGRVVNVASVHGLVGSPYKSAYVASKHGVIGFTKSLALEEAVNGITVNAVCPGYIRTELAMAQVASLAKAERVSEEEALRDILLEPMPLKRMLEPEEVANFVLYLSSDSAAGITGAALPIDGAWTAH